MNESIAENLRITSAPRLAWRCRARPIWNGTDPGLCRCTQTGVRI